VGHSAEQPLALWASALNLLAWWATAPLLF
jgi:hypothetical protein